MRHAKLQEPGTPGTISLRHKQLQQARLPRDPSMIALPRQTIKALQLKAKNNTVMGVICELCKVLLLLGCLACGLGLAFEEIEFDHERERLQRLQGDHKLLRYQLFYTLFSRLETGAG